LNWNICIFTQIYNTYTRHTKVTRTSLLPTISHNRVREVIFKIQLSVANDLSIRGRRLVCGQKQKSYITQITPQYIHLSVTFPRDNPCYQFPFSFSETSPLNQLLRQLVHFRHRHLHPYLAYLLAYHLAYLLAYHPVLLQQQHTTSG